MIDTISILMSTLACLFVLFRAVRQDRTLPWFGDVAESAGDPKDAMGRKGTAAAPADPWDQ